MPSVRINSVTLRGFRCFRSSQTLDLSAPVSAVLASNSQGKTSLAEGIEFLLTGEIVRRQLMASAQDEFADALRNVHLSPQDPVYVEARLLCSDGTERTIRRTLIRDYGRGRNQDSETRLEIDGKPTTDGDLVAHGCILSPPPLRAPVLAQHTLSYLFSAKPQERADYFRALLEVTDLEELRVTAASLEAETKPADTPFWTKFVTASLVPELKRLLSPFITQVPGTTELQTVFDEGGVALISAAGLSAPATAAERLHAVAAILANLRARILPLQLLDHEPPPALESKDEPAWLALDTYLAERAKVDVETRRLTALFKEALNLPAVADAVEAIDCPLCGTPVSLTPGQIVYIRARVAETEAYRAAEEAAFRALERLRASTRRMSSGQLAARPAFLASPSGQRRKAGFTVARLREIAGPGEGDALVDAWLKLLRPLVRRHCRAARRASSLSAILQALDLAALTDTQALSADFEACAATVAEARAAFEVYAPADHALRNHLKAVIDTASNVKGWQEFLDLAADLTTLRAVLVERAALTALGKELTQALAAIQKGNEKVGDKKFAALSSDIDGWWGLLRPDEPTFFSAVKPRPGSKRTVDFKAGLSESENRATAKIRDVIAIFSKSQLHCLGLALFLARALREGTTFLILDDPVLSSDEDHRAFFNTGVVERLNNLGIQIVILTQEEKAWKDLEHRYLHLGIGMFEMVIESALQGTIVTNTSDDLSVLLDRARTLARNPHRDLRRQAGSVLRDAAERFCKEMLVRQQRKLGLHQASINDYTETLGQLTPKTEPLLTKDPSHPGKLRTIGGALNPANHDDEAPGTSILKQVCGDLSFLTKEYLR